jgi:hypothetical protein
LYSLKHSNEIKSYIYEKCLRLFLEFYEKSLYEESTDLMSVLETTIKIIENSDESNRNETNNHILFKIIDNLFKFTVKLSSNKSDLIIHPPRYHGNSRLEPRTSHIPVIYQDICNPHALLRAGNQSTFP